MQIRLGSASTPLVSIVTPTISERSGMLEQLCDTVAAQTFRRWEHLILQDSDYRGCAVTMNEAAAQARAPWLFLIADDDLLLPHCLERLYKARAGADIVYCPPIVEGEDPAQFLGEPPGIPAVSLIRRKFWELLGGYKDLAQCEDCDFYNRALLANGVFHRVDEPGWVYRFHGKNKSRGAVWKTPQ